MMIWRDLPTVIPKWFGLGTRDLPLSLEEYPTVTFEPVIVSGAHMAETPHLNPPKWRETAPIIRSCHEIEHRRSKKVTLAARPKI